jgi:hypothetical protein
MRPGWGTASCEKQEEKAYEEPKENIQEVFGIHHAWTRRIIQMVE